MIETMIRHRQDLGLLDLPADQAAAVGLIMADIAAADLADAQAAAALAGMG